MKASKKTNSLYNPAVLKLQTDGYNLPSHDAMAQILPDYYPFIKEKNLHHSKAQQGPDMPNISHTYRIHHPHKRPPLHDLKNELHMAKIADLQTKEVELYRSAMSKMADDIIALRIQVVALEGQNSQLRTELSVHQDLGQNLLDGTDIEGMTKAEISQRMVSLKVKLASEGSKVASQGDIIKQLQNELIQKKDSEKELLKLQRVYTRQREDMQSHQRCFAKIASLEATVNQQKKVIVKMEKALATETMKASGEKRQEIETGESDYTKQESTLAAENTRFREELDGLLQQPANVTVQQSAQEKETLQLKERLCLLHKLKNAEARIKTLETQLEENSNLWGKEKQEMLTKLSESKHGFDRTTTAAPSKAASASSYEESRQRKQKAGERSTTQL